MKQIVTRTATAFVLAALTASGLAASAQAAPALLNGTYGGGDDENLWSITSSCGPAGCTGSVASNQGWAVPATFANGRWNFAVTKPDGVICADGRYEPAVISMSVDPVTLAGDISADSNYGCPGGILSKTPFQLHKVG